MLLHKACTTKEISNALLHCPGLRPRGIRDSAERVLRGGAHRAPLPLDCRPLRPQYKVPVSETITVP